MKRRVLSQIVATVLGGGPAMLLAAMADDCSGVKTGGATGVSITGVSTTINVNAAATGAAEGAAQGMDPAAGKKGATEYSGDTSKCRFVTLHDGRRTVECD